MLGMRPGFFTMNAISSAGSPPIGKNSSPDLRTNERKVSCVAIRTRWPVAWRAVPRARKGWTSPLLPTTWITMFNRRGALSCLGRAGSCVGLESSTVGSWPSTGVYWGGGVEGRSSSIAASCWISLLAMRLIVESTTKSTRPSSASVSGVSRTGWVG